MIVEPLVQGAAGHASSTPRATCAPCASCATAHGVLLICDEVATGFGRTGRMFACEHEDVAPDLLCLAKGITGGYLPLAATLATERVYEGFLGEHEEFRTFFHGHTYTGNPLACAAALATLDVFEEERTLERLQPKIELLGRLLEPVPRSRWSPRCAGAASCAASSCAASRSRPRIGHRGHARGAPPRRDHPPARRRDGADAAAGDLRGRAGAPGRDPVGSDRGRGERPELAAA